MKKNSFILLFFLCLNIYAEKTIVISTPQKDIRVSVLIPETITIISANNTFTETRSHIVQSIVEKAFVEAKYKISLITASNANSTNHNEINLIDTSDLLKKAKENGIDYLIIGQATAQVIEGGQKEGGAFTSKGSIYKNSDNISLSNKTYGGRGSVSYPVASAEVTAKIVCVKDGEIIAVEEAFAGKDGLSQQALTQGALREAANIISARLIAKASLLFER